MKYSEDVTNRVFRSIFTAYYFDDEGMMQVIDTDFATDMPQEVNTMDIMDEIIDYYGGSR